MALDLKTMKQKQVALQTKGNGKRWFWKPVDGEQTIRIVPDPDGDPFREFWFHYNLGDKPGFLSPKRNFGEDCPLDTFVRKLWEDGSDDSRELAKKLMAKQRFFSPVIVRGEEDQGVRLWGYSKTVYEKLLGLVMNPDYGDVTDPESGTDLTLRYGKKSGALFPSTDIEPRRHSSALIEDKDLAKEFVNTKIDYGTIFTRKSTAEVQEMLDEYLSDGEGNVEVEKYSAADAVNPVDKAFNALLAS